MICFIAHRGYSGRYQMNTEEAFLKAVAHGSGGIETDVRVTADGVLVVNHDDAAKFADGTELDVATSTYAELTAKPLLNRFTDTDLRVCTFRRYLEICRDGNMVCFIEFKGVFTDEQINAAFELAREVYDLKMCSLQSFEFDNLIRTHKAFPELQIMLTSGEINADVDRCLEYGFDIDMYYGCCTPEIVEKFHAKGLKVALWTANTKEALDACVALGVDYIESDLFCGPDGE
ncbi:MAG: hypothetical protein E7460_06060 [Ruminococcaceae bacterium]|nr:hypothetical protein [Oscillospiraceae bacterium]MBQ8898224.1 hypothetical protein [Clostridia bacterium]